MKFHSAREVHETYEELERLLALPQPPVVALELRRRFVVAAIDAGDSVWMAYGSPVAAALAASVQDSVIAHHPADRLHVLQDLLSRLRGLAVPGYHDATRWNMNLDRTIDRVRATLAREPTASSAGAPGVSWGEGHSEVAIPVVAELIDPRKTHPLFAGVRVGLLARLDVQVDFTGNNRTADPLVIEHDVAISTRAAFANALVMLDRFPAWGAPATHRCTFRARFTPPGTRIVGRSGTLAFLLAAAAARATYTLGPAHAQIEAGTAITGDLDGTKVIPVDPGSLEEKMRACVHGNARRIVLPMEQEADARRVLEPMVAGRRSVAPELIPVADALTFWSAGRPPLARVRRSPRSLARIWSDRLTRSRARAGLLGATATLLAALLLIWLTLRAAPPVSADWEGNDLVLRNTHRLVTERIDLPHAPDYAENPHFPSTMNRAVVDLNRDRLRDAIAIHGSRPRGRDLLTAVDGRGRVMWSHRSDQLVPASVEQPGDMLWWMIALMEGSEGEVELLALSRSHQGSLSIIGRLDPVDGSVRGALKNQGHFDYVYPIELPGIDRELLAFCGTENRMGRAITALLDPIQISFASDSDPAVEPPRLAEPTALSNGALAVWSFAVDRFTSASRSSCQKVYRENDGSVRVEVSVDRHGFAGTIIYELDAAEPRMPAVLGAYFVDGTKAYLRGLKDPIPDAEFAAEARRLAREVQTLTPDGWRPARLGPDFLPAEAQPVSSSSAREGLR